MKIKRCTKCKERKPLSEFYEKPIDRSGFRSRCKECMRVFNRKYKQMNKVKFRESMKKYRKTLRGYLCCLFSAMKNRCNDPKAINYKYYGGRGIKVKFKSSQEFTDYVINELQIDPRGLDIDRIDNNGHYEKGNIQIVTHQKNCSNRKRKEQK